MIVGKSTPPHCLPVDKTVKNEKSTATAEDWTMHKRRPEKYIHRRLSKLHNSGNGDMTDDTARTFSGLPYFCLMAHAGMQLEAQAEGGGGESARRRRWLLCSVRPRGVGPWRSHRDTFRVQIAVPNIIRRQRPSQISQWNEPPSENDF